MKISTNQELDYIYHLGDICFEQESLDNMFHFLKLREKLSHLYNEGFVEPELSKVWIQNIIIITSSLIETVLLQTLLRIKNLYDRKIIDILDVTILNELTEKSLTSFSYKKLIEFCIELGILSKISENKLNQVRKLRNNIHISNSNIDIEQDKRLNTSNLNDMLNLFLDVCESVFIFLSEI